MMEEQALICRIFVAVVFGITITASTNVKECFKGQETDVGNITITCPKGQVISIDEALFGRNRWGACVISDDDCNERTRIFQECENLNNCTRTFKTYSTQCGYATVVFIGYSCLQENPVIGYTSTPTTTSTKKAVKSVGPQFHITTKIVGHISTNNGPDNLNETGLIAGCVVAAVITVIALVIAISMVVRHLMQKNIPEDSDDDEESNSLQSKGTICCLCTDCFSCLRSRTEVHKEQNKFKLENKPIPSSVAERNNNQAYVQNETIRVQKNSLMSTTENIESGEHFRMSTKNLTAFETIINNEEDLQNTNKLDTNFNTKMKPIKVAEKAFCNSGTDNSPKASSALNNDKREMHNHNSTKWENGFYNENVKALLSSAETADIKINSSPDGKRDSPSTHYSTKQTKNHNPGQQVHMKMLNLESLSIPNTE